MPRRITVTDNMTKIDLRCIEQGSSRTELAERSGVPRRTLENWSARTRLPRDVYQLHKVAQALGCRIEDIMEPESPEDSQGADAGATGTAQENIELPGRCLTFLEWLGKETKSADKQSQDCKKAVRNARWEDGDMLQRTTATIQADSVLECLKKVGEAYKAYRAAGRG